MPDGSTIANYNTGDIVTFLFHDGSQLSNQVISLANEVWFELPYDLEKYTGAPKNFDIRTPGVAEIVERFRIKNLPAIVFVEKKNGNQWEIKTTLTGNVSKQAIEATYYRVIFDIYGRGDNTLIQYESEYGVFMSEDNGKGFFLNQLGKTAMWILTGTAAYKSIEAKNGMGKAIWGGLATYGGYQLFRKGKSTIHFE